MVPQARRNAPLPPLPPPRNSPSSVWFGQIGRSPVEQPNEDIHRAPDQTKSSDHSDTWAVTQRTYITLRESEHSGPFTVGGILGQGGFGTVLLVRHLARRTEVAMKVMKHTQDWSAGSCRGIINELKVLSALATQKIQSRFLLGPYLGYDLWAWRSSKGYMHVLTV